MGACLGSPAAGADGAVVDAKTAEIDRKAAADARAEQEKVKLLLLGAGESGKSTIFKQMKIIHGVVSDDDRRMLTPIVHQNTILAMKTLVHQVEVRSLDGKVSNSAALRAVKECEEGGGITPALAAAITALWQDPVVQLVWQRRSEYQIVDSVAYFFYALERISAPDYVATPQDMVFTRVRTTGIVTDRYLIDGTTFELYDVGGQRNERKKWIHCFSDVTAVIFVAALSEYDQTLFEEHSTNRVVEALHLFGDTVRNAYFAQSSIILLLNKRDLFEDKVSRVPIRSIHPHFSDYAGADGSVEDGIKYFTNKFLSMKGDNVTKDIYVHVTCATDTHNVAVVFSACKDTILKNSLKSSGFA